MRNGRYVRATVVIVIAMAAAVAIAVTTDCTAGERSLTLTDAALVALENNHDMKASRNSLFAQKEEVGVVRGALLPHVAFEERAGRTDNPPGVFMAKLNQQRFSAADFDISSLNNPRPTTDLQTLVSVDQAVFAGGALVGLDMAKKEYAAMKEDFGRRREETVLAVAEAYLRVRTAKEYVRVSQAGLDDAKEHMRIAESRYRNALGLYADVLRAKTVVIEAEQKIVTSEKNLSVAKRALSLLLGTDEPVDVVDAGPDISLRKLEEYQSGVLSRRDLRAMRIRYENAKNGVRMAESRYLPSVGVRASYQWNDHSRVLGSEGESWWLMGVLKWDLFDGASREFERSKARYRQAETEERLKGFSKYVSFKINEAFLSAKEAEKNAELSASALAAAEEGRKLVKGRYENSLTPVVDLLDVQVSLDHARAGAVARKNEYHLAVLRLACESGTILEDLGIDPAHAGRLE
jgi:outer membrane protein